MEVSGQLHAPAVLPPGKDSWYPLDRRLGGPQSRSGRGGENIPSPLRKSNPRTPIVQPVAQCYCYKCQLILDTRVYPEVSGLAVWSENYKWYSCLPLGAVIWLFCDSV
jgi:hypothetical protein